MQSIEIAAPSEVIFDLIHDYSRRLEWDPFLKDAVLLDAECAAAGTVARCTAHNGLAMDTVYVSFNRPEVAAVKMVKGPRIFSSFGATIRQEAIDEQRTRVTYRYNLETKPRFLRWFVDRSFAGETRKRLEGLKAYVERGTTPYLDRRLPMPRAKMLNAYEIPAALAFYVIAIAVVAMTLDRDWLLRPRVSDLFLFAGVYLASIAIHELGHLLGGLAGGFEFQHLRISLLVITRSRLSLEREWTRAMSGEAKMRDTGKRSLREYSVMVASGPAANLVSALLVHSRMFLAVSLIIGLTELMPFARRTNVSDGARLKMLWFDRRRRERWIALFRLTADSSDAKFPDRMSPKLLAAATAVRDRSIDTVTAHAFAYSAAMSRREYEQAATALDVCMEFAANARPRLRNAIISDAAVYQAAVRKSPELAREWLHELPANAAPKLRDRAEAAISEVTARTSPGDLPHRPS